MKRESDHYAYRVHWSDEDREWVALCVELPGLSWLAGSPETALRGIRKVVAETMADMASTGEEPPEPLSMRRYSGRFQVRIPPEEHRKLVLEAAEQRVSLNRLVSMRLSGSRP